MVVGGGVFAWQKSTGVLDRQLWMTTHNGRFRRGWYRKGEKKSKETEIEKLKRERERHWSYNNVL